MKHFRLRRKRQHPYPLLHGDFVVVADGVFPQEVKLYHVLLSVNLRVQLDVLHPERAAAHGVGGLSLLLLVTCSQSQLEPTGRETSASRRQSGNGGELHEAHLVDEVERHGPLPDPHLLGLPVLAVLVSDAVHTLLQPARRLVLLPVLFSLRISPHRRETEAVKPATGSPLETHLDPGAGVQHDVLNGALDVLRPRHQPRYLVVMANFFPLGSWRRLRVLGVPLRRSSSSESQQ